MPVHRPRRLDTFDYTGFHRYHVRVATWNRVRHFSDPALVHAVIEQLLASASTHHVEVTAYCVMPDHVHLLIVGQSPAAQLTAFVSAWKQRTGYAFARSHRGTRLWQPSYFDRVLRENEATEVVARYIVENPVRAGLASRLGEYPHAWCKWPLQG